MYLVDSESESILRTLCGKTVTGGTFKSGIWKNLSPVTVYPLWIASSSQRLEFMRLPTHDYTLDKCTTTFCIHNFPRRLSPPFMAIFLRGTLYFGQENPQNLVYRNSSTGVLPGKFITRLLLRSTSSEVPEYTGKNLVPGMSWLDMLAQLPGGSSVHVYGAAPYMHTRATCNTC